MKIYYNKHWWIQKSGENIGSKCKKVNNIISKVYKDSIAEEIGIEVGDLLISVNEQPIHDIIEYRFLPETRNRG